MLWLAGLMGIVGAGAASIVYVPSTPEVEDNEPPQNDTEEDRGNLFDHIHSLNSQDLETDDSFDPLAAPEDEGDPYEEAAKTAFEQVDPFLTGDVMLPDGTNAPIATPFLLTDMFDGTDETAHDRVAMGDWITEGTPAEVVDYDLGKDSLLLVWDDLAGLPVEPEVRVESDPYDSEVRHVMMNNSSVAEVYGDPNLGTGDITMIPLSSALIVGLEPA